MFGSGPFYHSSLRNYTIAFGNLFNDISIQRYDQQQQRVQTIGVPLRYGPKQKFIALLAQDPNLDREIAMQTPMASFEILAMNYASERKTFSLNQSSITNASNKNQQHFQYEAVPWNIDFALHIYISNAEDGIQIIEQILPFFTPKWTMQIKTIDQLNDIRDTDVSLTNVIMSDDYEGSFEQRRVLTWTLNFTMKALFYGPVTSSKVIKTVRVDLHSVNGSGTITDQEIAQTGRSSRIITTPGLLANGAATTNSDASISISLIGANDVYGIAQDFFFYTDGLKYNPKTGSDE
jgi:hypothetical protein